MDESSEAVGWVIRALRFERWLDALASEVDVVDVDRGERDDRVEEARRPA